jgi:three-Cys-motif partner protein
MSVQHQFGGSWTEEKLERIRKYLSAYTTIFTQNHRAANLRTIYVDAFAGTGYRTSASERVPSPSLPLFDDDDAKSFQKGSAHIALEVEPPFNRYLFIEPVAERIEELQKLKKQFSHRAQQIDVRQNEANDFLRHWCADTDWRTHRAVVFLDPYGMEVEWPTIEAISRTQAIDLWLLFPLGQAVNRLLTRYHPPTESWANRLTKFFGTDEWEKAFYRSSRQGTLFGPEMGLEKEADFDSIGDFFVQRLERIFAKVAKKPLPLRNSKNVPIYLLCFAAANPKGAPTAVKIAEHILKG